VGFLITLPWAKDKLQGTLRLNDCLQALHSHVPVVHVCFDRLLMLHSHMSVVHVCMMG
jgi:hypothetical protein